MLLVSEKYFPLQSRNKKVFSLPLHKNNNAQFCWEQGGWFKPHEIWYAIILCLTKGWRCVWHHFWPEPVAGNTFEGRINVYWILNCAQLRNKTPYEHVRSKYWIQLWQQDPPFFLTIQFNSSCADKKRFVLSCSTLNCASFIMKISFKVVEQLKMFEKKILVNASSKREGYTAYRFTRLVIRIFMPIAASFLFPLQGQTSF